MKTRFSLAIAIALGVITASLPAAEKADPPIFAEIKDAQKFLAAIYAMPTKVEVENAVNERVKVGDSIVTHRALLSEAMRTQFNPFSNRFIFHYEQAGVPHDPGSAGWWIIDIETDVSSKVARVSVNIAKK